MLSLLSIPSGKGRQASGRGRKRALADEGPFVEGGKVTIF